MAEIKELVHATTFMVDLGFSTVPLGPSQTKRGVPLFLLFSASDVPEMPLDASLVVPMQALVSVAPPTVKLRTECRTNWPQYTAQYSDILLSALGSADWYHPEMSGSASVPLTGGKWRRARFEHIHILRRMASLYWACPGNPYQRLLADASERVHDIVRQVNDASVAVDQKTPFIAGIIRAMQRCITERDLCIQKCDTPDSISSATGCAFWTDAPPPQRRFYADQERVRRYGGMLLAEKLEKEHRKKLSCLLTTESEDDEDSSSSSDDDDDDDDDESSDNKNSSATPPTGDGKRVACETPSELKQEAKRMRGDDDDDLESAMNALLRAHQAARERFTRTETELREEIVHLRGQLDAIKQCIS